MTQRVVIVSVAPLFPDVVYGGSQAILTDVAVGLGKSGLDVELLCSARPENEGGFKLGPTVNVRPLLKLTGAFPEPYEVHPAQLARTACEIRPILASADVVYLHADIFHFRGLIPEGVPVIRSFHDYHYETALVSAFAYSADLTIVPSRYLANCIAASVGVSGVRTLEPIRIVPNGIDLTVFNPDKPNTEGNFGPRSKDDLVLLYPHRPDERKGILEALEVVARLKSSVPDRKVRLIVPRHIDADRLLFMRKQYQLVESRASEIGVSAELEFVSWVTREEMPAFFRYGDVTLCLGSFIEAFGLTPYESIACGTPVVAANVGAYREFPHSEGVRRVGFGDHDAAADAVHDLAERYIDSELPAIYETQRMIDGYLDAILNTKSEPVNAPTIIRTTTDRLTLAPWCYPAGERIYDDYAYGYRDLHGIARFLSGRPETEALDRHVLGDAGIQPSEIDEAVDHSVLIPDFERY